MAHGRNPKVATPPATREIKTGGNPESTDSHPPSWQFHRMDREHSHWGWKNAKKKDWVEVLATLKALEGMSWAQILQQAGGKGEGKGTNHHPIPLHKFCRGAKARWSEIGLEEFDTVFSLRCNNTIRIYGIRIGGVMRIVWYDTHHGSKLGAYPMKK